MSSTEKDRERDREPLAARIVTKLEAEYKQRQIDRAVTLEVGKARTDLLAKWIAIDILAVMRDDEEWTRLELVGEDGGVYRHCICWHDTYGPKWGRECGLFTKVEQLILDQAGPGFSFEWTKTSPWLYQCRVQIPYGKLDE